MARVERGNVVLDVDENDVPHYLNLGYNLTDNYGNVLQRSIPTSVGELQAEYVRNTAKIAELEDAIAKLTTELTTLKAQCVGDFKETPAAKKKTKKVSE